MDLIPFLKDSDFEKLGVSHVGERIILLSLAERLKKVSLNFSYLISIMPSSN